MTGRAAWIGYVLDVIMAARLVASVFSQTRDIIRAHWPFAVLAAIALALILTRLGSDYLWGDEGDTAVLASNIVKFGVPKAWDGITFTDSDRGARVNDELVMVSHPWVQYYLAAGAFVLFGENTFAARLPFALAGWMSILLVYILVWRTCANRSAAFCAAALLVLSVQFLLYSRQSRNYSINILFTCWLIWIFFKMKSARTCVLFAFVAILLFHTHPIGIVPVGALGILTLTYRPFAPQRRWFWLAFPVILIFTLPWLALAQRGYAENTARTTDLGQFLARFGQYWIECASVTPFIGVLIVCAICLTTWKFQSRKQANDLQTAKPRFLEGGEAALLVVTLAILFFYAVAMALSQSTTALWHLGIRYTSAVIPLVAMVAGILIVKISRGRWFIWIPLLLIFSCTKLAQLTPWLSWRGRGDLHIGKYWVGAHLPLSRADYFFGAGQLIFLGDLFRDNPGITAKSCEFLKQYARAGDLIITNADWDPLYFHSRFPQALKILPEFPVNGAARRRGLPEYVFGVDHARWVIWRPQWDGVDGYFWFQVQHDILAQGGQLTQVAELEETIWENRESIHFHRFSGNRYLFPWFDALPAAQIYRVDWRD